MNKTTKAHLAVLAANFIFGAGYAVVKTITPEFIAPFALNVVRVLSSLLLFWLLFLMKPSNAGFERKHLPRFLLCALTGVAINQLLFIKGLSLTTAIHSSLLSLGTPIFITIIAAWLLKEKLTFNKIAGLTLGIGGATLLILMKDNSTSGKDMLLGDILIIINAISYAFYLVLVRPLMEHYKPIHVLRWVFTFGTFMILPFGLEQFIDTNWAAFGTTQWVALTFVALFVTFFAYLFNVYGLSVIGSSATGSYIYTQPVFAAIIAMVFMGEHFTITKALAALCIFSGVYLVNIRKRNL
ncbi:MAG: DMT family transporter [Sediminibacterium sp.]|jgi:drug/metabolite transporter (DMT)-like permease|uniref:DMT family transporter n=1 Tax=Sediminibacterium sp. TaxID=1917865 RepID=UPI002AB94AC9|nr:DMT family transporter [Sediminibacterium sp.]MDZ4071932.1 DMT family transporter [Sediminibacterium sp.]